MDVQQARYFLALCDELNFTRAALRCGITQPSLTNAIKRLEKEFGGKLFERRPSTRLSTLGRVVRPHLKKVVKSAGLAQRAAIAQENARRSGSAVIGGVIEDGFGGH